MDFRRRFEFGLAWRTVALVAIGFAVALSWTIDASVGHQTLNAAATVHAQA